MVYCVITPLFTFVSRQGKGDLIIVTQNLFAAFTYNKQRRSFIANTLQTSPQKEKTKLELFS